MKRFIISISFFLLMAGNIHAENQKVDIDPDKKNPPETGTTRPRAPMLFPVQVFYDTETRVLEITSGNSLDGNMYLYDVTGNIIAVTSTLDETVEIPTYLHGIINLYIETETWTATGEFSIH